MDTKPPADTTSGTTSTPPPDPKTEAETQAETQAKTQEGPAPSKDAPVADASASAASPKRAFVILLVLVAFTAILMSIADDDDEPAPTASPNPTATASASASASTAPATSGPGTPTDLQAEVGASEVRLTWAAPTGGTVVAGYLVSRDGEVIATLGEDELSFVDRNVQPVASHGYDVAAFDADGYGSPSPASVTARTTQVPVDAAWLNGPFDVTLRETSHFGYVTFGDPPTDQLWTFSATCAEGICPVDVTVKGIEDASFELTPVRTGYEGSFRTDSFVRCDGVPVTTTVKVDLSITDAASVKGAWAATEISGDVSNREAPQGSCDASGVDFSAVGTAAV